MTDTEREARAYDAQVAAWNEAFADTAGAAAYVNKRHPSDIDRTLYADAAGQAAYEAALGQAE